MENINPINPNAEYQIVYEVDNDGVVIENHPALVFDGEIQTPDLFIGKNMLVAPLPRGIIKPKWMGNHWIEVATPEDIANSIMEQTTPDTEILGQQMTERELESMLQGQQLTDFELRLFEMEATRNV